MSKFYKAIRMATTIEEDDPNTIREVVTEALTLLMQENNIQQDDIISAFFTLTNDIKSFNPATAAREALSWNSVPMICAHEAFIEQGLQKCIRALIHVSFDTDRQARHIYLRRAKFLREDWS